MAGQHRTRILHIDRALEHRLHKVACHTRNSHDERHSAPQPQIGIEQPSHSYTYGYGTNNASDKSLPRLKRRDSFAHTMTTNRASYQIGKDIIGPHYDYISEHNPRIPHSSAEQQRHKEEQSQRQCRIHHARKSGRHIRYRIGLIAHHLTNKNCWHQ